MFKAPLEPIDTDTRRLIVWGLSFTMLSTILIRSYSFGFGRHPSKNDTRELYWLKVAWWSVMSVAVTLPQLIDRTICEHYSSQPLVVLIAFGCLMSATIMFEAAMSNIVAMHLRKLMVERGSNPDELTYLTHAQDVAQTTGGGGSHGGMSQQSDKCAFPVAVAPKKEHT